MAGPRAPSLHAIHDIFVTIESRRRGDVGGRRAGVGFGYRDGHRRIASDDGLQEALSLFLGAEQLDDASGSCRGFEDREGSDLISLRDLLDDDEGLDQFGSGSAVLLGQRDAEEPDIGEAFPLLRRKESRRAIPLDGNRRVHVVGDLSG